jgi:hypothetical protein
MAHVGELGLLALALLVELGIGVGGGGMRVVCALLPMEVVLAVAAPVLPASGRTSGWLVRAVLGAEALHARPGFHQRAVDREVLVG